jgi:HSP20 family protein
MAGRNLNSLNALIFSQLESAFRQHADMAMRAVRFQPSADMYETEAALVIKMELPGVKAEEINITLSADDRLLTVSGERYERHEDRGDSVRYYQLEIYYGSFERQLVLPGDIRFDRDGIKANYRDGFLVISLPRRAETESEKRTIEISKE